MALLTYKIVAPDEMMSDFELTLFDGQALVHRTTFQVPNSGPTDLMAWFMALSPFMRNFWMMRAGSFQLCDAHRAFLLHQVFNDAQQIGVDWALSRQRSSLCVVTCV